VQSPSPPIIVKVVEESEIAGLGDVMVQAIGLTGALAVGALALGVVLAVVIIGYRKFKVGLESDEEASQTQSLGLTPTGNDGKSKI